MERCGNNFVVSSIKYNKFLSIWTNKKGFTFNIHLNFSCSVLHFWKVLYLPVSKNHGKATNTKSNYGFVSNSHITTTQKAFLFFFISGLQHVVSSVKGKHQGIQS